MPAHRRAPVHPHSVSADFSPSATRASEPRSVGSAPSLGPDEALGLQDALGNQGVSDLISRLASGGASDGEPAEPFGRATSGAGGEIPYREEMEASFGRDFSNVEAHFGQRQEMRSMGARAAAQGHSVAFADDRPSRETVAHELTHVVQQEGSPGQVARRPEVSSPSDAAEREAEATAARVADGGEAGETGSAVPGVIHREGGTPSPDAGGPRPDAGGPAAGTGEEAGVGTDEEAGTAASTPEKQAFEARRFVLANNTPSTGIGKFDAAWEPRTGILRITLNVHFRFVEAQDTPGLLQRIGMWFRNEDTSRFFWSDQEKEEFASNFVSRIQSRWSGQHSITCVKPDWEEYSALPVVTVNQTEDAGAAHYSITVHKSSNLPQLDYRSGVNNENLTNPGAQPTADLWQSDVQESGDFNSNSVATQERTRIDGAIAATQAGTVHFERDSARFVPGDDGKVTALAARLNQANPSAPMVPLDVTGFASAEGNAGHNQDLSLERAEAVSTVLGGQGVRQPIQPMGMGPIGTPGDAANRRADIATDTTFESSYSSNRYSVAEHEAGHMFGLPDEYTTYSSAPLQGVQTRFDTLVTSAGLSTMTYSQNTSSQMSNGVDILPQHYTTFWEALGRMTAPDILPAQWSLGS